MMGWLIAQPGPSIKVKERAGFFLCPFAFENYFRADASNRAPVAAKRSEDGRRAAAGQHRRVGEPAGDLFQPND